MLGILKLFAGDDDDDDREVRDTRPTRPRRSMTDPDAWDAFWRGQFDSGVAAFVDMLVHNGALVDAMRANKITDGALRLPVM